MLATSQMSFQNMGLNKHGIYLFDTFSPSMFQKYSATD